MSKHTKAGRRESRRSHHEALAARDFLRGDAARIARTTEHMPEPVRSLLRDLAEIHRSLRGAR
jgi:hypothetical protein